MSLFKRYRLSKNFLKTRNLIILINNLILINLTLYFSYFLRTEKLINISEIEEVFYFTNFIYFLAHSFLNIENQYFRYFNIKSLKSYFYLNLTFLITLTLLANLFRYEVYLPRSVPIIFPIILFLFFIIQRFLISKFYISYLQYDHNNTIVIGFDIKYGLEISKISDVKFFVDNNKNNIDRIFNGSKIININKFLEIYKKSKFNRILILNNSIFNRIKNDLREYIFDNSILVQNIVVNENIKLNPYFDFNYFFDREDKFHKIRNELYNKSILITGAGGSIGSGIVDQITKVKFKKLILVDISEYNLFKLKEKIKLKNISFHLLNFEDLVSISQLIKTNKINLIIHAAAYKHVPLVEENIFSALKNNFLNTHKFIELSCKLNVSHFCLISSDKAVRPSNFMGATKRLAELSTLYHDKLFKNLNLFCVRFGNVINSSGSVLPILKKQINQGGPITITHKSITRYFMTIEEASNLVISSFKISKGGEIFLLDMGQPIKILDLAKKMTQFSGKKLKNSKGQGDIALKIIGLRDGEKLYEELLVDNNSNKTAINYIHQSIENNPSSNEYKKLYKNINNAFKEKNKKLLINTITNNFIGYKNK